MGKVLFIPFSVVGGYVAGFAAKKAYSEVWGLIEGHEPPSREHRDVRWRRVLLSSVIEGAIFYLARSVADRGSRQLFFRLTGSWPGEAEPEPE